MDYEKRLMLLTSLAKKADSKYEEGWFLWDTYNHKSGFKCLICGQSFLHDDGDDTQTHGDWHIANCKLAAFI